MQFDYFIRYVIKYKTRACFVLIMIHIIYVRLYACMCSARGMWRHHLLFHISAKAIAGLDVCMCMCVLMYGGIDLRNTWIFSFIDTMKGRKRFVFYFIAVLLSVYDLSVKSQWSTADFWMIYMLNTFDI